MDEVIEKTEVTSNLSDSQLQDIEAMKTKVQETINQDFIAEVIKGNNPEFVYKEITYRIGKLSYDEKQKIYKEKVKKYTQLLRDPEYALERDLKKSYLLRGIDIDALTKQITNLDSKKHQLQIKLGELLKKDGNDVECETLKKEIESIQSQQQIVAMEKQSYLEYSIENQVILHIYNYMTSLATEKKSGETWVKAFKTFDEFLQQEEELVGKLAFLITMTSNMQF